MSPATTKMIDEIMDDLSEIEGISFNQQLTLIPTGIDLLDTIAGGGIPVGKLISIAGAPGGGKCLGKGTPILMYDGSIKKVEDVIVGDVVMGDDSTPRNVLAITSGQDEMFIVEQEKFNNYKVNSKHILSLKHKGEVKDICITDYIKLENKQEYMGYKATVDFTSKEPVEDDVYSFMRTWIEDESNHLKYIPTAYKYNTKTVRLNVLAAFLDEFGYLENDTYVFMTSSGYWMKDFNFIATSLGYTVNCMDITEKSSVGPDIIPLYKIYITGKLSDIPVVKKRKNVIDTDTVNENSINVVSIGEGQYFGFQIDGNQRFLLGDFTVTHNSTLAGRIAASFQLHDEKAMVFYVDSEQAMSYDRLKVIGCDLDRTLLISEVITLENVCKVVEKIIQFKIKKKLIDIPFVFIWDSESASPTEKQLTIDDPAKLMGFKARLLSHILPKMTMDQLVPSLSN